MKVKELINLLYKQHPEHDVYVRGYEIGVNDVQSVHAVSVIPKVDHAWYEGTHEVVTQDGAPVHFHAQYTNATPGVYLQGAESNIP